MIIFDQQQTEDVGRFVHSWVERIKKKETGNDMIQKFLVHQNRIEVTCNKMKLEPCLINHMASTGHVHKVEVRAEITNTQQD